MENEPELSPLDPRPLVIKRMVWDIFPHDYDLIREVQGKLGLVPDHDEGLDVEHAASDTRVNKIVPLQETIDILSGFAGEVLAQYLVLCIKAQTENPDIEVPGDVIEAFEVQNAEVLSEGVFAIVSHLMDTGVLAYGEKIRKLLEDNGE
jgi:hypothetical protein